LAESSPYFEVLKKRNVEVLFCYDTYDEVTMLQLRQFDRKTLTCAEKGAAEFDPKSDGDDASKYEISKPGVVLSEC